MSLVSKGSRTPEGRTPRIGAASHGPCTSRAAREKSEAKPEAQESRKQTDSAAAPLRAAGDGNHCVVKEGICDMAFALGGVECSSSERDCGIKSSPMQNVKCGRAAIFGRMFLLGRIISVREDERRRKGAQSRQGAKTRRRTKSNTSAERNDRTCRRGLAVGGRRSEKRATRKADGRQPFHPSFIASWCLCAPILPVERSRQGRRPNGRVRHAIRSHKLFGTAIADLDEKGGGVA
jgi:hypothetical protein